jgi:hypothetical protein
MPGADSAKITQRAANPAITSNQSADRPAIPKIKAAKTNVVGSGLVLTPASALLSS